MDLRKLEEESWLENNGHVLCWMTKNTFELSEAAHYYQMKGYFFTITGRWYPKLGKAFMLRVSRIAAFIRPQLAVERAGGRIMKREDNFALKNALLLDPNDMAWKGETRLWAEKELAMLDEVGSANEKSIAFLKAAYEGTL